MKTVTTNQGSVKERIIETIDQLRQRKARPDLERISHMLERKYGLKASETEGHIEKLVDSGDVVKVEYKGSTSYRNGAKWRKHHLGGQILNSKDVSERIIEAIRSLVVEKCVDAKQGVPLDDIESWLVRQKEETYLLNETLKEALNREVDIGKMRKLANGNYSLTLKRGPKPGMSNSTKTALKRALSDPTGGHSTSAKLAKLSPTPKSPNKSTHSDGTEIGSPKRGRPFSKRKRIKKNHGPDFESYDPAANERRMCDFCLQTEKKRNGQSEDLLVCIDCNAKAHPSCMDYSESLARRARRAPWQCIDCKTCFICQDAGDPDAMLFCDACDKGYHMKCHVPTITEKPKGKWACAQCVDEGVKFDESPPIGGQIELTGKGPLTVQINSDNGSPEETDAAELFSGASCLPTPCDSPITEMGGALLDTTQGRNGNVKQEVILKAFPTRLRVTNAATWSIDDVMTYISDLGFQEQADNFKEQEIDGQSLLLLRRNDVLTGLSLKLGPALKLYNFVMDVQTHAKTS